MKDIIIERTSSSINASSSINENRIAQIVEWKRNNSCGSYCYKMYVKARHDHLPRRLLHPPRQQEHLSPSQRAL